MPGNFLCLSKILVVFPVFVSKIIGITSFERAEFYMAVVPALELLCDAFPPLVDDAIGILINLGKICTYQNSVERNRMCKIVRNKHLLKRVHETYERIVKHSMLDRKIF